MIVKILEMKATDFVMPLSRHNLEGCSNSTPPEINE
jgi:hypothetical protein